MTVECVINISEGTSLSLVDDAAATCADVLLDVHRDRWHNRSVLTLAGEADFVEAAAQRLASWCVRHLDIARHHGVHPRVGTIDVVPFIALERNSEGQLVDGDLNDAIWLRDRFALWAGSHLHLPCFLYGPLPEGPVRPLPEIRRQAFGALQPDTGPIQAHPLAGGCAVGARPLLVAYNVWLAFGDLDLARRVATQMRGPGVRAIGLDLEGAAQVSCNLIDPFVVGIEGVYDEIVALVRDGGGDVARAELVGLVPAGVLAAVDPDRWLELDLRATTTIEARLDGGQRS